MHACIFNNIYICVCVYGCILYCMVHGVISGRVCASLDMHILASYIHDACMYVCSGISQHAIIHIYIYMQESVILCF